MINISFQNGLISFHYKSPHPASFIIILTDVINSFFQQVVKPVIQLKLDAKLNIIALKIPFVEIKTIISCFKTSAAKNNKSDVGASLMKCYDTHSKVISIQIAATCVVALCMPTILQIFSFLSNTRFKNILKYIGYLSK